MILLRPILEKDLPFLEKCAGTPGFINLPSDSDVLAEKIQQSVLSFSGQVKNISETKYIFVAEDTSNGRILGTSMIAGQHGTDESPHFYFQVSSEKKYSDTISTGFIHGTLELRLETNGPSEIGGLMVDPDFRNTEERLGRQIAFVRFLFLALYPKKFKTKMIAELLPPLNKKGQSPLWEAIGRRFTNMDYWEADSFSQKSKEFILSLFPSGKIYTTFLPADARNAIGKVGKSTEPVFHMLTKIGFEYQNQVDPFDGGPHLWVETKKILPVKNTRTLKYGGSRKEESTNAIPGLIASEASLSDAKSFRAVSVTVQLQGNDLFLISSDQGISADIEKLLCLTVGETVAFMPYY